MIYILTLMLFTSGGYAAFPVSDPLDPPKTEEACRELAKQLKLPEMPPPNTNPATWPAKGWTCTKSG